MERWKIYSNGFERSLLALDRQSARQVIESAAQKESALEVVNYLVTETLKRIGESWEKGKISLSQVYMSGVICEELIDELLPPSSPQRTDQPTMAIGVFEDFHMLGKRIILSTLRASGYELIDLGGGLVTKDLVQHVKDKEIRILLLSVLMLPSALRIQKLSEELSGLDVKLVVGGAPFRMDQQLCKAVGADAFGNDSNDALEIVHQLTGGLK